MAILGFPTDDPIDDLTEFDAMVCSFYGTSEMMRVSALSREEEKPNVSSKDDLRLAIFVGFRKQLIDREKRFGKGGTHES